MFTNTQDAGKDTYAALYQRAKRRLRCLSWGGSRGGGKKEFANLREVETERPWAGLAEWLRLAHSLLDGKAVELTRNADR